MDDKLNDDKTEFIIFSTRNSVGTFFGKKLTFGDTTVEAGSKVRNLGVIFDQTMSMQQQVNTTAKSCRYYLRCIGRIRKYLSDDDCKTLVHALVTSRLDYGNVLLLGLPEATLNVLQRVQNCAARLITCTRLRDHITPVLLDLHWLPIRQRIDYKTLLYTFKILNGLAPTYLGSLITPYQPKRQLRSSSRSLLAKPKVMTKKYGSRIFNGVAAMLWNDIIDEDMKRGTLDSFKKNLKTHLFLRAYSQCA